MSKPCMNAVSPPATGAIIFGVFGTFPTDHGGVGDQNVGATGHEMASSWLTAGGTMASICFTTLVTLVDCGSGGSDDCMCTCGQFWLWLVPHKRMPFHNCGYIIWLWDTESGDCTCKQL